MIEQNGTVEAVEEVKPNSSALASLTAARAAEDAETAVVVAPRGRGRPRKDAALVVAPSFSDASATPNDAVAEPPKRKNRSGKKKSRRELEELVRGYKTGTLAPKSAAVPVAPVVPVVPVMANNPERMAEFASGTSRFLTAVARFIARRKGVHWLLQADEAEALGECAADCLAAGEEMAPALTPYLELGMKAAPFAMLAGVLYEVVDSRLEIEAEITAGSKTRIMPAHAKAGET